jgi:hypothetical protein
MLVEGQCYGISHADIRPASKFNKAKHIFELHATKVTEIEPVEEVNTIPNTYLKLKSVEDVLGLAPSTVCDMLVAVKRKTSPKIMNLKNGQSTLKTDLEVYDTTARSVSCVFWGLVLHVNTLNEHEIVLLRNVIVKEYMGKKSLSFSWNSRIETRVNHLKPYRALLDFVEEFKV